MSSNTAFKPNNSSNSNNSNILDNVVTGRILDEIMMWCNDQNSTSQEENKAPEKEKNNTTIVVEFKNNNTTTMKPKEIDTNVDTDINTDINTDTDNKQSLYHTVRKVYSSFPSPKLSPIAGSITSNTTATTATTAPPTLYNASPMILKKENHAPEKHPFRIVRNCAFGRYCNNAASCNRRHEVRCNRVEPYGSVCSGWWYCTLLIPHRWFKCGYNHNHIPGWNALPRPPLADEDIFNTSNLLITQEKKQKRREEHEKLIELHKQQKLKKQQEKLQMLEEQKQLIEKQSEKLMEKQEKQEKHKKQEVVVVQEEIQEVHKMQLKLVGNTALPTNITESRLMGYHFGLSANLDEVFIKNIVEGILDGLDSKKKRDDSEVGSKRSRSRSRRHSHSYDHRHHHKHRCSSSRSMRSPANNKKSRHDYDDE